MNVQTVMLSWLQLCPRLKERVHNMNVQTVMLFKILNDTIVCMVRFKK